jgi:hypothetical protein
MYIYVEFDINIENIQSSSLTRLIYELFFYKNLS